MTRIHVTSSSAPSARTAFQRKLAMIGVVGTVLPLAVLAVLALMYLLAPLPMTTGTAEILRMANRFAATIVLLHWAITLAVWAATRIAKPVARRDAGWKEIQLVRRINA